MSRFGDLSRKGWRGIQHQAGTALAGTALFLLAFLLGLHLFFPTAALQQWLSGEIATRTLASVRLADISLRPVFTLGGKGVTVSFNNPAGQTVVLDELSVQPLWSSLVTGDPGVALDAALLQGRLTAALRRGGGLALHAAGMKLTDVSVHQESRTLLSGTVIRGDLEGSFPARKGTETRLALEIDDSVLTVLGQPVPLGRILLEGGGQGNNVRIATLTASGGAITIAGSGNLLLGASAAASRINLDLTLRPTPSAPPTLTALLDVAGQKQPDNSYRLRLSGSPSQLTAESPAPSREQPRRPADDDEDD